MVNPGNNIFHLDMHNVSKGMYLIKLLSTDGGVIADTQKIIVE